MVRLHWTLPDILQVSLPSLPHFLIFRCQDEIDQLEVRKQVWSLWCIFIPVPNHPPSTQPFHLKKRTPFPKSLPSLQEVPTKKGPKLPFHFQGSQDSKPPRGPQPPRPHSPMVNFCFVVLQVAKEQAMAPKKLAGLAALQVRGSTYP